MRRFLFSIWPVEVDIHTFGASGIEGGLDVTRLVVDRGVVAERLEAQAHL